MRYFRILKLFALIPALLAAPVSAVGQDGNYRSWYVGMSGDITDTQNSHISGATSGPISYDFGGGGNIDIGYMPNFLNTSWGDWRVELEGGYHALTLDKVAGNHSPSGALQMTTAMSNIYYDFHPAILSIVPYIGAGAGDAHFDFSKKNGLSKVDDDDDEFAYQFMFGTSITPEMFPRTDFGLGYRFIGTEAPAFETLKGKSVELGSVITNSIEASIRYHF